MTFWIGILVAALFAWSAVKVGFYGMWAMLFNIIISVYLAIFLRPGIVEVLPEVGNAPYDNALAMIVTAVASFLVLQGITYTFFTAHFTIPLPKILDVVGAGVLGFWAGLLVWSFASLLIAITPIVENSFVKEIIISNQAQQINVSPVCRWCNFVNIIVSRPGDERTTEQMIDDLLTQAQEETEDTIEPAEPNEPTDSDEKNTATINTKSKGLPKLRGGA